MTQVIEISIDEYQELKQQNQVMLLDIREPQEYASEYIVEAINVPLSTFNLENIRGLLGQRLPVFHCLSGMRTKNNSALLAGVGISKVYILSGGLNSWKHSGLLTHKL